MTQARRRSIRKRGKAALALGAAGVSLVMTGGASATAPAVTTTTDPTQDNARRFILGEEEISDVTLATFHVFDKEKPPLSEGIKLARGGCGGCGGCGRGGGCGGCAHAGGCAGGAHVGGCAVGGRCTVGVGCGRCAVGCTVGGRCTIGVGCAVGCAITGRCAIGGRCGCRGGCACSGVWIGIGCLGCAACVGTCWQWDPFLGQWVSICY